MPRLLWTQKQDVGPAPRFGPQLAYDFGRKRVVLFGGRNNSGLFGDTWEWDGEYWTQVADTGPSLRSGHSMVYENLRTRVVLFGGEGADGAKTVPLDDTWEWDGENWTQVADTGPRARLNSAIAYDEARHRAILFGGAAVSAAGTEFLGDTWAWDGAEWTQLEDTGPARSEHAMVFDALRARTVLFGGLVIVGGGGGVVTASGDTWEWDGHTWTLMADFGPSARQKHAMTFDGTRVVLFGGNSISGLAHDTWVWGGKSWTLRQDMGPAARFAHALAYDYARSRVVLFGGAVEGGSSGDTWELAEQV